MTEKCCATCAYWSGPIQADEGQCEWPEPERMPFWASISRGRDHEDATSANQGRRCPAWVIATRLCRG